eukprot:snap_masked-scaffold_16-processed-gene-2.23-mRNA-1 protein AED:1.00 eAED:1.00 QI:0/-1/0/0/-1/1/1/0/379
MSSSALYFIVFNLNNLKQDDIQRLKFWCGSILRNAKQAPVILIGTHLRKYLRHNPGDSMLESANQKVNEYLNQLTVLQNLLCNENMMFFPLENAYVSNSQEIILIKDAVRSIVSGEAGMKKKGLLNFEIATADILFMDNCREERNVMSVKEFKQKALFCGFEDQDVDEMLQKYSDSGLICFFKHIGLSEVENLIFFAPPYLAQALGNFIRDPSLHQLAFRVPNENFYLYRNYIDTGKISKQLFEILLREYTTKEKRYVLQLALKTFILIKFESERDAFLVPELLPDVSRSKIKPSFKSNRDVYFHHVLLPSSFARLVMRFRSNKVITQCFLYKNFARFLTKAGLVIDAFVKNDKTVGFSLVQGKDTRTFKKLINQAAKF